MVTRTESTGKCSACGVTFSKRQMLRHLSACAYPERKDVAAVAQIRVDVPSSPFWLDLDVKLNSTMLQLDEFLRDKRCCRWSILHAWESADTPATDSRQDLPVNDATSLPNRCVRCISRAPSRLECSFVPLAFVRRVGEKVCECLFVQ